MQKMRCKQNIHLTHVECLKGNVAIWTVKVFLLYDLDDLVCVGARLVGGNSSGAKVEPNVGKCLMLQTLLKPCIACEHACLKGLLSGSAI